MKAYEFYVLLGKYKRKTISKTEYERFNHAFDKIRNYRRTFQESTGEDYPRFPDRINRRTPGTRFPKQGHEPRARRTHTQATTTPQNEFVDSHSNHALPQRPQHSSVDIKSDDRVTSVLRGHRAYKRVRTQSRNRRGRWHRLLRDIARNNKLPVGLAIGVLAITFALVIFKPGFNKRPLKLTTDDRADTQPLLATHDRPSPTNAYASLTTGRILSEADQLLAINPRSFEIEINTNQPIQAPITGLEQAIQSGLESMFPDPETSLPKIETVPIE